MSQGTPPAPGGPSAPAARASRGGWAQRRSPAGVPENSNDLAQERTDLATDRTLMAADRSLMAWIRTALSMISFGFTIYKVLEGLEATTKILGHPNTPRIVGLFLTTMGTFAMVFGTIEYWTHMKSLRTYRDYPLWRPSFVMALLMSAVGVLIFFAITFKAL